MSARLSVLTWVGLLLLFSVLASCTDDQGKGQSSLGEPDITGFPLTSYAPVDFQTRFVIFDTDIGNDIDDAIALRTLYKLSEYGYAEILATISNKSSIYSALCLDVFNTYYGHSNTRLGVSTNTSNAPNDDNYTREIYEAVDPQTNEFLYQRETTLSSDLESAVDVYRDLLANSDDSSITIISVGFLSNLSALLASPPDHFSSLDGLELVEKKVKALYVMGGNFESPETPEYNIWNDIQAAQQVVQNWPGEISFVGFSQGLAALYKYEYIASTSLPQETELLEHAYRLWGDVPYDRPSWDILTVIAAFDSQQTYFSWTAPIEIQILENGSITYREGGDKIRYITINNSIEVQALMKHLTQN